MEYEDENIPLTRPNEDEIHDIRAFTPDYGETTFTTPDVAEENSFNTPRVTLTSKTAALYVDDLYKLLSQYYKLHTDARYYDNFEIKDGKLYYKESVKPLTNLNGFLKSANTLIDILGIRRIRALGFEVSTGESAKKAARKLVSSIPTELQMEALELSEIIPAAKRVEKELRAASTNTDLDMQRVQGEFANNLGKLTEITGHISREQSKLDEMKEGGYSEEQIKEVTDRISKLKEEYSVRLELASQNRKELQSQFARIRQTIEKVPDSDTTLAEKIKTLFREQDITIAAVLTSFAFIIDAIVNVFGGGVGGTGGSTPSKKPSGVQ